MTYQAGSDTRFIDKFEDNHVRGNIWLLSGGNQDRRNSRNSKWSMYAILLEQTLNANVVEGVGAEFNNTTDISDQAD